VPEIAESFEVEHPVDRVWSAFQDVPHVASCIPGAVLGEDLGGGTYRGTLSVKLGAMQVRFEGTATVTAADEDVKQGTIEGNGVDRRGGSRGSGALSYRLTGVEDRTRVDITASYRLQGPIAQFGRTGIIEQVARSMTRSFAGCVRDQLGEGPFGTAAG
jgi:uncharacterized protein